MELSEYLPMFLAEGREHLQELNLAIIRIEEEPDDQATVDEIFRIAHSMKGMSATMGFAGMAALTHAMEDVLELLRQRSGGLEREAVDVLLECLDGGGRMARVLVVDDAAFMRKMVTDALVKGGHEVIGEAGTGTEAVERYVELKPEVTTLDITMPEKDGLTALKEISRSIRARGWSCAPRSGRSRRCSSRSGAGRATSS
jgi:chemotaxis protein histidine kinase CheA